MSAACCLFRLGAEQACSAQPRLAPCLRRLCLRGVCVGCGGSAACCLFMLGAEQGCPAAKACTLPAQAAPAGGRGGEGACVGAAACGLFRLFATWAAGLPQPPPGPRVRCLWCGGRGRGGMRQGVRGGGLRVQQDALLQPSHGPPGTPEECTRIRARPNEQGGAAGVAGAVALLQPSQGPTGGTPEGGKNHTGSEQTQVSTGGPELHAGREPYRRRPRASEAGGEPLTAAHL